MMTGPETKDAVRPVGHMPERSPAMRLATAANRSVNDPAANWWMITFSDLTILLLGFAVLWHATVRSPMEPAPAQLLRGRPSPPRSPCRWRRQWSEKLGKLCKTI